MATGVTPVASPREDYKYTQVIELSYKLPAESQSTSFFSFYIQLSLADFVTFIW